MEEKFEAIFQEKLEDLKISLSPLQKKKFFLYLKALQDWNRKINLTSIEEEEEIILKHFVDSLSCIIPIKEEPIEKVIDIGTGAGFPGIPLKILNPNWKITLLESQKKKIIFLEEIVRILELTNIHIIWDRAENLAQNQDYREKYDLSLARGVAKPNIVLEYSIPFLKISGIFLAQATEKKLPEWETQVKVAELLGGKLEKTLNISFDDICRTFLIFRKEFPTPSKFPRRPGIPEKRPLSL
ncbi:MAG TPA: 16S rRNA (guanine(527)-N(7))-methyltransferase RsmG [Dictyoglomaceae bacterium]|nr:16S rRNA (guanine(527)-N(7))-methyltransferase RsmG [Dictyoglomaceae bacterium]